MTGNNGIGSRVGKGTIPFAYRYIGRKRSRIIAGIIVALLLIACIVPFISSGDESSEYDGTAFDVVYHSNDGTGRTFEVTYKSTFVSTAYNPQIWSGTAGESGAIVEEEPDNWNPVTSYRVGVTVFAGWSYYDGYSESGSSFTGVNDPGDILETNTPQKIHLFATWESARYVTTVNNSNALNNALNQCTSGSPYTNIILVNGNNVSLPNSVYGVATIRGIGTGTLSLGNSNHILYNDLIIDDISLSGSHTANHGDYAGGIFANGHMLILGTGINTGSGSSVTSYPQIFGGTSSSNQQVSDTCLIIHSGTYGNVMGGSGGWGGAVKGDTKVVLRNVTILDTLAGGSGTNAGSIGGSTWIYALSLDMPGDYYEETKMGNEWVVAPKLTESTIITGGSNGNSGGAVAGSTNILISGTSKVWDVQGGGRRGGTTVEDANLTISGDALIKHIACGGITDGTSNGSNVQNVNISISDCASIAMLLGGGYDTWGTPSTASTVVGDIRITITGGTIGYVYGGGFRGVVGSEDSLILITINGGRILGDVYGGGRGGFDKVLHNSDGSLNASNGTGMSDTTGYSKVTAYAISIDVCGDAVIDGSVYGGGQSTPIINQYGNRSGLSGKTEGGKLVDDIASVVAGSVSVTVSGNAVVKGSMFTGGKGIDTGLFGSTDSREYLEWTSIICMDGNNELSYIPWFNTGTSGIRFYSGFDYTSFASSSTVSDGSSRSVSVMGGTVYGSVYGGGAIGTTDVFGSTQDGIVHVTVLNGTVKGSVYGGGMGLAGSTSAGSVVADVIKVIVGGEETGPVIQGSVYGGGALSHTTSSIEIQIRTCSIGGNIFSGGLGTSGIQSTSGTRSLTMTGGRVKGSVYGSSSLGNDGDSETPFETDVWIVGGVVDGSVYGGGFKGETYGNVKVVIGGDAVIEMSVYGGADVGTTESTSGFNEIKVFGTTLVTVDGLEGAVVNGSVFGSGNSCAVSGDKMIVINGMPSGSKLVSIQNADRAEIKESYITLSGRADGTSSQASTKYSLNNIGRLFLINGTHLVLKAGVNNIDEYRSQVAGKDGVTSDSSESNPMNSIRLSDGVAFEIKNNNSYGRAYGFTVLTLKPSELYYGALAYASVESDGGFMIERDGSYVQADMQDFTSCRCWFISGTMLRTTTIVALSGTVTTEAVESIPRMSTDTRILYTGHTIMNTQTSRMELVSGAPDSSGNQYRLTMGYSKDGCLTFGNNGIVISGTSDSTEIEGVGEFEEPDIAFNIEHAGIRCTGLAGSLSLSFVEVAEIDLGNGNSGYIYQNHIDLRIDIYTESVTDFGGSYEVPIVIRGGSGSGEFVIPKSFYDYSLILTSFDVDGMDGASLTMNPGVNNEGTLGWSYPLGDPVNPSANIVVGNLTGSFHSTVFFNISGASGGENAKLDFILKGPNGETVPFQVSIKTESVKMINITFIDYDFSGEAPTTIYRTVSVAMGSVIPNSMIPVTGDCFVGWYQDRDLKKTFNLSNPVTHEQIVYAGYSYTATFDLMNGKTLTEYAEYPAGSRIYAPVEPQRDGYTFVGWYKDSDLTAPAFGLRDDKGFYEDISSNVTFYAKWEGLPVTVTFYYAKGTSIQTIGALTYGFGDLYGSGTDTDGLTFSDMTSKAEELAKNDGLSFVRWVLAKSTEGMFIPQGKFVYDDMALLSASDHVLVADCEKAALKVTLNGTYLDSDNGYEEIPESKRYGEISISAPKSFLVYPADGRFVFTPSNASTVGYKLHEWRFVDSDGNPHIVTAGVEMTFVFENDEFRFTGDDGRTYSINGNELDLAACWTTMRYEVHIQEPIGGSILVEERDNDATILTGIPYGTELSFVYIPEGPYSLKSWELSGEGSISPSGDECILTVKGNCLIYVRLGGAYSAEISLTVDGLPADGISLKLVSGVRERPLTFLKIDDGRAVFHNTAVETGYYKLCIQEADGTWLKLNGYVLIQENTALRYDLYTLSVIDGNGEQVDRDLVSYPGYAMAGDGISIALPSIGYDHGVAGISPSTELVQTDASIDFEMPSSSTTVTLDGFGPKSWNIEFDGGEVGLYRSTDRIQTVTYGETHGFPMLKTKDGYTFSHWEWIDGDTVIKQYKSDSFTVEMGIEKMRAVFLKGEVGYTVQMAYQTADGTGYVMKEYFRAGVVGATVSIDSETVDPGFHISKGHSGENLSGTIDTDLVLTAYYDRDIYHVESFIVIDGEERALGIQDLRYGASWNSSLYTIPFGYASEGWYSDSQLSGSRMTTVPLGSGTGTDMTLFVKGIAKVYRLTYDPAVGGPNTYVFGEKGIDLTGYAPTNADGRCFDGWSLGGIRNITTIDSTFLETNMIEDEELNLVASWGYLIDIVQPPIGDIKVSFNGAEATPVQGHEGRYAAPSGTTVTLEYEGDATFYRWILNGNQLADEMFASPIISDWNVAVVLKLIPSEIRSLDIIDSFVMEEDGVYTASTSVRWVHRTMNLGGVDVEFNRNGSVVVTAPGATGAFSVEYLLLEDTSGNLWKVSLDIAIVSDIVSTEEI